MSEAQRKADLLQAWSLGILYWLLDSNQAGIYDFIHGCGHRRVVLNCSRRIGKTFLCVLIAIEHAIKHPNSRIKFAASTSDDLEEIVEPIFDFILSTCPEHLRPKWRAAKGKYIFPNKSQIKVAGCDDRRKANRLRGTAADLIVIEEAGSIPDLKYVMDSVLSPQLLSTGGMMLIASTPPDSIGHEFVRVAEQAMEVGAYVHRTIFDCPRYTEAQRESLFRMVAGKMPLEEFYKTEDFRREFGAELLSDSSLSVLKYATLEHVGTGGHMGGAVIEGTVVKRYRELERPEFFRAYEGGDLGWSPDPTGWLFAYWHFEAQTLVVERELLDKKMTTDGLAKAIEEIERDWLGPTRTSRVLDGRQPPMRWGDFDKRFVADMETIHHILLLPTAKDDLKTAVNAVNLMIPGFDGKLAISPTGCPELLKQMKAAIWAKNKKEFARMEGYGHFDLVAALVYLVRNLVRTENPVPPGWGFDPRTQFRAQGPGGLTGNAGALKRAIFGRV